MESRGLWVKTEPNANRAPDQPRTLDGAFTYNVIEGKPLNIKKKVKEKREPSKPARISTPEEREQRRLKIEANRKEREAAHQRQLKREADRKAKIEAEKKAEWDEYRRMVDLRDNKLNKTPEEERILYNYFNGHKDYRDDGQHYNNMTRNREELERQEAYGYYGLPDPINPDRYRIGPDGRKEPL